MEKVRKSKYRNFQLSHELGAEIDDLQAFITLSEKTKLPYEELIQRLVRQENQRLKNENKV
jgi:hypothetical protein